MLTWTREVGRTMVDDKYIGLALAICSSFAIGTSFIITKKVREMRYVLHSIRRQCLFGRIGLEQRRQECRICIRFSLHEEPSMVGWNGDE